MRDRGHALIMVLVAMLILQAAAWIFLSRMNIEQRLAGGSPRTYVVPCRAGTGSCQNGGVVAASGPVWFGTSRSALNDFRSVRLSLRDGSIPDRYLLGRPLAALDPDAGLVDLVLARSEQLRSGREQTVRG